jgi:methyl-accepting chemotaxis protein
MAQGIENVTKATIDTVKSVNMIHQSGEETVKASESVAQEAQSLSHIAEVLKSLVQKFKI